MNLISEIWWPWGLEFILDKSVILTLQRKPGMLPKSDFHGCSFFYGQKADGSDGGEQIWPPKEKN